MAAELAMEAATDLLGIELNRARKVQCPHHVDDTPSLHIYEEFFLCYSCGATGDSYGLIAAFKQVPVAEVLRQYGPRHKQSPLMRRSSATLALSLNDVQRHTQSRWRNLLRDFWTVIHEAYADSPMGLYEYVLAMYGDMFDETRDLMMSAGLYHGEDPLTPYGQDQILDTFEARARKIMEDEAAAPLTIQSLHERWPT